MVPEVNISDIVKHIIMLSDNADEADAEAHKLLVEANLTELQLADRIVHLHVVAIPYTYINATFKHLKCQVANALEEYFYPVTLSRVVQHKALPCVAQKPLAVVISALFSRAGPSVFC